MTDQRKDATATPDTIGVGSTVVPGPNPDRPEKTPEPAEDAQKDD